MRVFLLRHAEAHPGVWDEGRELTAKGRRQIAQVARGAGLVAVQTVRAIEHSPLVRSVQSAERLQRGTKSRLPLKLLAGIKPESDDRLTARQLAKSRQDRLIVGHNPHLAALAGRLLGMTSGSRISFRKAGLMALEREAGPTTKQPYGRWRLLWYVVPDLTK